MYLTDLLPIFNIFLHSELQDGMKNQWDPKVISEVIREFVTKHKINTVRNRI